MHTFDSGAGAGPSGLRPQFLLEMVGEDGDGPVARAICEVAMLFVEGKVPRYLRQLYGGGGLMGIGKDDKPLHEDARPIVVGEAWRRVAAKMALLGDKAALGKWLQPIQWLAVGTAAGVEAAVHRLRQCWARNTGNKRVVLLKNDYENAFNEADPAKFLESWRRRMPGSARLAEWCYGEEVTLVYRGRMLKSSRGQQGFPLMMPLFCAMRKDMRDRERGCEALTFSADFADGGDNRWGL